MRMSSFIRNKIEQVGAQAVRESADELWSEFVSNGWEGQENSFKVIVRKLTNLPQSVANENGIDLNQFDITGLSVSTYKEGSAKVTFKARNQERDYSFLKDIYEDLKKLKPPKVEKKKLNVECKNLRVISIADQHLGMLAWAEESGENYNIETAKKLYIEAIKHYVATMQPGSDILLELGNDFFNSNSIQSTTVKGTQQHDDTRWAKQIKIGVDVIIQAIQICREFSNKVYVSSVFGNHDTERLFSAVLAAECFFYGEDDVIFDNKPAAIKTFSWNGFMAILCHGEQKNLKGVPQVIANTEKDKWAKAKYIEVHCAHKHTEEVFDINGTLFRRMPSLSARAAYASLAGYYSNRACQALDYREDGFVESVHYFRPENIA